VLERSGDLREETAGEDVGEVCDLVVCQSCCCGLEWWKYNHTFKLFLVSRTFARASQASIPSVLPKNLTSSTSLFSFRAWIWGSMSSAVVSFRPLPSSEKSLDMLTSTKENAQLIK
jgi:hypothetical protein